MLANANSSVFIFTVKNNVFVNSGLVLCIDIPNYKYYSETHICKWSINQIKNWVNLKKFGFFKIEQLIKS